MSVINLSLFSVPRRVCGRVLTERLMLVTAGKVSEEQGEVRKEKAVWTRYFQFILW